MSRRILILAMGLLWMTGCSAFHPVPDLGNLYTKLAQQEDPLRNPVIVIPGILGSRLEDGSTGDTVWDAFGSGAVDPHTGEGARTVGLAHGHGLRR
ncbi:MAG: hypothetical protein R3B74_15295 [Nitrospirales bacterium]|nr:hypothetical protein [Nitrospirales bacterium]